MNDAMKKLAQNMPEGIDAVLVTSSVNRYYYTGLASSAGTLLVTKEKAYFIIDFRYIEVAKNTIKGAEVTMETKLADQLLELVKKHGIKRIGIESQYLNIARYIELKNMLPGVELAFDNATNAVIVNQRRTKSAEEIEMIQRAQSIADKSLADLMNFIRPGRTELEVAVELETLMRRNGSTAASFGIISVAGPNSSKPHGVPSDYVLKDGDFLTLDFGATYNGYVSDMTRTFGIGHVSDEMRSVYDKVLEAQLAALAAVRPGVPCNSIDKIARDIITQAGYGENFGHGLGHSLGLEVHENPRFNQVCTDITAVGNVMSVEPGIYLDGRFGVRIEDIVVITENGYHNFASSPKELIILG